MSSYQKTGLLNRSKDTFEGQNDICIILFFVRF